MKGCLVATFVLATILTFVMIAPIIAVMSAITYGVMHL